MRASRATPTLVFLDAKRHPFSVIVPPQRDTHVSNASLNPSRVPPWFRSVHAVFIILLSRVPLTIRELNTRQGRRGKPSCAHPKSRPYVRSSGAQLQAKGFVAERAPETATEGEKDKVFRQEPAENSQARKQSVVKLTMSAGVGRTAIVNVEAFSLEESKRTLEGLNLKVTTAAQTVQSRDVAQGLVVRTNPPATSQVDVGSTVELVLSDGPPPKPMPPLTGEYTQVSNQLVAAGFGVMSPPVNKKTTDTTKKGTVAGCTVTDTKQPCSEGERRIVAARRFRDDATNGVPGPREHRCGCEKKR